MINWKEISELHVIAKLEEILNEWFGVEVLFADEHYKVKSKHLSKEYEYKNHFFKVMMDMNYGQDFLEQDVEKTTDSLLSTDESTLVFESHFRNIRGVARKVDNEGEFSGTVIAFPFIMESVSAEEIDTIVQKMVEAGADEEDAKTSVNGLQKLSQKDKQYLVELMDLVGDEIKTFHHEISKREERIHELNSELGEKFRYHNMIGKSKKMQAIYHLLEKISTSESSVFIQGENGTGKELVAKAVHYSSPRKNNTFLAVNCSAFNDNLLDSELFGHVKGAFTGAIKDKKGLFEQANGGTLFLDEIGDTSLSMQVKLLRVLQEGTYLPVGATSPKKSDVRIIAATNRDVKEMMKRGDFREDLFYRINVINLNLPSIKERPEDIPLLIEYFLDKRCAESGVPKKTISKKCMEYMLDYHWPGNVRELENEVERLVVLAGEDKMIQADNLSPRILESSQETGPAQTRGVNTNGTLKNALEELETIMIREGLKRCNFNKSKLAKELGISRASLIMKVDKYGLDKRKKAAGE
ncbi:MAG: sigma 54-interacting transcriptional regulator [Halobacteriovoraceae bacterium]|nr:sigma 54-interacting transcriptional regulator [Halobacteriovoraceae bacterium]